MGYLWPMRRRRAGWVIVAALSWAPAPANAANDNGVVHVDPGSPSGKQYAIPLTQARRDGAGQGGAPATAGDTSAPLFGDGIKPSRAAAAAAHGASAGKARSGDASGRGRRPSARQGLAQVPQTGSPAAAPTTVRAGIDAGNGDSATLVLFGGGAAVLLLGGVGGSAARRFRRRPS